MMSAYSAVSHGHSHPELVKVLLEQAQKLAISSRAFYTEPFAEYIEKLSKISNFESVLPMNTGAEAVETAIKAARRWGYFTKGIKKNCAEIIVAEGNFHGVVKEEDKYLISADKLFLSEILTNVTPNIPKEFMEYYDLAIET